MYNVYHDNQKVLGHQTRASLIENIMEMVFPSWDIIETKSGYDLLANEKILCSHDGSYEDAVNVFANFIVENLNKWDDTITVKYEWED